MITVIAVMTIIYVAIAVMTIIYVVIAVMIAVATMMRYYERLTSSTG